MSGYCSTCGSHPCVCDLLFDITLVDCHGNKHQETCDEQDFLLWNELNAKHSKVTSDMWDKRFQNILSDKGSGIKYDDGKLEWHLLPIGAIEEVIKVLQYGSKKYGEGNWKKVEPFNKRYYNAMMRHLVAFYGDDFSDGEEFDESGYRHIAHAVCCGLFLLYRQQQESKQ